MKLIMILVITEDDLNPLLDDEWAGLEPLVQLLNHFCHQLVVGQLLSDLHNPVF